VARWRIQRRRPDDGIGAAQVKSSGILDEDPNLGAYVARGEARPAYKRPLDALNWQSTQLAVYTGKPLTG
jgi:glutathione S-transferase